MTIANGIAAAICAAVMCSALPRIAHADSDIEKLRQEFEEKLRTLQQEYETRLKALESRQKEMPPVPPAAAAAPAGRPTANPDVSLILQGQYLKSKDPAGRGITGFMLGEREDSRRGFSVGNTELIVSAAVDPYFRGFMNASLAADGGVEVEETWFQTLALGNGLTVKAGRFLSGIGYVNEQHPHAWDFADQSLMYRALFGEHLVQDGVQVRWLAPTETYLELGVEAARGQFFPGSDDAGNRNGPGAWAAFAKVGGDVGVSHSWLAGLNYFAARPRERADLGGAVALTSFTGDSTTWIADFVWKWAPEGNSTRRNFKLQAEYFRRTEDGALACLDSALAGVGCSGLTAAYRSEQSGWYLQGVYQFMPRWRVGYRYDRLDAGDVPLAIDPFAGDDYRPSRNTLMADYSFSEFSRLRLQVARDRSMRGVTDNQIWLQYIHSLGAHGAHRF